MIRGFLTLILSLFSFTISADQQNISPRQRANKVYNDTVKSILRVAQPRAAHPLLRGRDYRFQTHTLLVICIPRVGGKQREFAYYNPYSDTPLLGYQVFNQDNHVIEENWNGALAAPKDVLLVLEKKNPPW